MASLARNHRSTYICPLANSGAKTTAALRALGALLDGLLFMSTAQLLSGLGRNDRSERPMAPVIVATLLTVNSHLFFVLVHR